MFRKWLEKKLQARVNKYLYIARGLDALLEDESDPVYTAAMKAVRVKARDKLESVLWDYLDHFAAPPEVQEEPRPAPPPIEEKVTAPAPQPPSPSVEESAGTLTIKDLEKAAREKIAEADPSLSGNLALLLHRLRDPISHPISLLELAYQVANGQCPDAELVASALDMMVDEYRASIGSVADFEMSDRDCLLAMDIMRGTEPC